MLISFLLGLSSAGNNAEAVLTCVCNAGDDGLHDIKTSDPEAIDLRLF